MFPTHASWFRKLSLWNTGTRIYPHFSLLLLLIQILFNNYHVSVALVYKNYTILKYFNNVFTYKLRINKYLNKVINILSGKL